MAFSINCSAILFLLVFFSHTTVSATDLAKQIEGRFSSSTHWPELSVGCRGALMGNLQIATSKAALLQVVSLAPESSGTYEFKMNRIHALRKRFFFEYGSPFWISENQSGNTAASSLGALDPERTVFPIKKTGAEFYFLGRSKTQPAQYSTNEFYAQDAHYQRSDQVWNGEFLEFLKEAYGDFFRDITNNAEKRISLVRFKSLKISKETIKEFILTENRWYLYNPATRQWFWVVFDLEGALAESASALKTNLEKH